MAKIAFVDWSNYEYGGDITYISDFKNLSERNGTPLDIFFYKRSRKSIGFEIIPNKQTNSDFIHFSKSDIDELFERLKSYDFVCFVQTPHQSEYKKEQRQEILERFKSLKAIKGLQAHIWPEPPFAFVTNLFDYIAASDVLITREDDPEVPTTVIGKKLGKTIIPLTLYSDLDKFVDHSIDKKMKLLYRGRFDSHKRPFFLGNLSYHLKELIPEMEYELMGIDATIGAFARIHSKEWADTYRFPERDGGWVKVSKPFAHSDGIKEMQRSMFGYSPRTKLSGSYLEYAQIEVLQTGGILVLSKKEGENSYLPDGTRWIDIPHFAIWLDEEDLEQTAKDIVKVANDPELQQLYRSVPKDILASTMDEAIFKKHLDEILNAPKTDDEVADILRAYHWERSEIEKFNEINSKYVICPFVKYLKERNIYLYGIGGRKPILLKEFEDGTTHREPKV